MSAAAAPPRVLASTTSHKREPLLPTLEVFARLGMHDIDLNLHHILEDGVSVEKVQEASAAHDLRIWIVSGGWCDFFHGSPGAEATDRSVARQVEIAQRLGARQLRLFFGRLTYEEYTGVRPKADTPSTLRQTDTAPSPLDTVCGNLRRLAERHPDMLFNFENHDGASLHPEVCAEILGRVARPNIRMNFDPINFERAGVSGHAALDRVHAFVGHVHLKGLEHGEFCEFGVGDVDLHPVLLALRSYGYGGGFTVEYEGHGDGTLRLYESVKRAQAAVV
jgi:sugar phosphate isomerase/epimerase